MEVYAVIKAVHPEDRIYTGAGAEMQAANHRPRLENSVIG